MSLEYVSVRLYDLGTQLAPIAVYCGETLKKWSLKPWGSVPQMEHQTWNGE